MIAAVNTFLTPPWTLQWLDPVRRHIGQKITSKIGIPSCLDPYKIIPVCDGKKLKAHFGVGFGPLKNEYYNN